MRCPLRSGLYKICGMRAIVGFYTLAGEMRYPVDLVCVREPHDHNGDTHLHQFITVDEAKLYGYVRG